MENSADGCKQGVEMFTCVRVDGSVQWEDLITVPGSRAESLISWDTAVAWGQGPQGEQMEMVGWPFREAC